jgi:hypothetical protein
MVEVTEDDVQNSLTELEKNAIARKERLKALRAQLVNASKNNDSGDQRFRFKAYL